MLQSNSFIVLGRALGLFMLLAAAGVVVPIASASTTTLCYDDRDGACEVNLVVPDADVALLGNFLVCDTHFLFASTESVTCPSTTPGIYVACAPASGGYCNMTLVRWATGLYQFDVTTTGASAATFTMGGFASGNYTARVDGTGGGTFVGSNLFSVNLPTGSARRVQYELVTTSTPGASGGAAPPAAAAGGTSGVAPVNVIVKPGDSSSAADDAGAVARRPLWIGLIVAGLVLVVVGAPKVVPHKKTAGMKSKPWLAVPGVLMAMVGVLSLVLGA